MKQGAPLDPAQQRFKIRKERDKVAMLEAVTEHYARRIAGELAPEIRAVRDAQRRFALALGALLDGHEQGDHLSRRHRSHALAHMLELIEELLLGDEPDAALEALLDATPDSREPIANAMTWKLPRHSSA